MKCHQLPVATASFKGEGDVSEEESVRLMWNAGLCSAQNMMSALMQRLDSFQEPWKHL